MRPLFENPETRYEARAFFITGRAAPRMHAEAQLRIVSGGQTGVDRAALDAALAIGLPVGGWCPLGRLAEDGEIPARYPLVETESPKYPVRTARNVADADATLILTLGTLDSGSRLTANLARRMGKPFMVIALDADDALEKAREWLRRVRPAALNVAGPRESKQPGIYGRGFAFLSRLLRSLASV